MLTYLIVSTGSGLLFAVLDALINANPLARRLYAVYQPLARTSLNFVAGIFIDIAYGFILAGLFLLLAPSLPGASSLLKGVSFAVMVWFLRVAMGVLSQWMTYKIPPQTLLYTAAAGLGEMLSLGLLYGLVL
jgi:hypothetical protein